MSKGANQTLYRNEMQVIKASRKIIPMPLKHLMNNSLAVGARGDFSFNLLSGVTVSNKVDKVIWGISDDQVYNFDTALQAIHPDYQQIFTDNSLGAIGEKTHVEFELVLANGNRTKEIYEIIGHTEDYQITTDPVFINGTTQLIKKAVNL